MKAAFAVLDETVRRSIRGGLLRRQCEVPDKPMLFHVAAGRFNIRQA